MPFMKHEITNKITWIRIDGTSGITYVPSDSDPRIEAGLAIDTLGNDVVLERNL